MRLMVELDGATVPLADCDWVLWSPCGCPRGVTVCRAGVVSEEDAWRSFFPSRRERDLEQERGLRMELMTHERWVSEVVPLMRLQCPHTVVTSDGERLDMRQVTEIRVRAHATFDATLRDLIARESARSGEPVLDVATLEHVRRLLRVPVALLSPQDAYAHSAVVAEEAMSAPARPDSREELRALRDRLSGGGGQ